jgi:hypothetical protein
MLLQGVSKNPHIVMPYQYIYHVLTRLPHNFSEPIVTVLCDITLRVQLRIAPQNPKTPHFLNVSINKKRY